MMPLKSFYHPFEPYDIQQSFMETVYDCIEQSKVGLFESPTGTGKSLSLLCGSLTWLREHKRRNFDEALATVQLEDDDPEWMMEHARETRSREIRQMRDEFEKRLSAVRERERKIKERLANSEPPAKRQKAFQLSASDAHDEEQYVLDDYESDNEQTVSKESKYSAETTKLMRNLGLLPNDDEGKDAGEEIEELKVYFCSRTHSQLSQFVGELKRVRLPSGLPPASQQATSSKKTPPEEIKHLTLGSRKNLCINSKVSRLSSQVAINERCIDLQQSNTPKDKKCPYLPKEGMENVVLEFRDHALAKIRDIEDLFTLGSELQICPYYASRPSIGPAEIITLPYPLLLQKSAREALGISLKGHVVVVDEAHNIINAVESAYSARISDVQLKRAKDSLIFYLQKFRNRLKGSNRVYVTQMVRVLDSLFQFCGNMRDKSLNGASVSPTELLAGKGVDQINLSKLVRYINDSKLARKVEGYATFAQQSANGKEKAQQQLNPEPEATDVPTLTHAQNFLVTLMNPAREGDFLWSKENGCVVLQYLLLDPSEHFRDIVEEARSVILAGGTMSPMEDFRHQLFPYVDNIITFSCGHLIPSSNLFVRAITLDHRGSLEFSFKARNDDLALRLNVCLRNIASKAKGGMVVFFPSYGYLEGVLKIWQAKKCMSALNNVKPVFSDDRNTSAEETFRDYSEAVRTDHRGALLLSVIGGKLSEGINFSDDLGRCVVVIGLPYPNLETPAWKAKVKYLEDGAAARGEARGQASRAHAETVCMRSVNQAIGRAIRHKNDWASILLLDARFAEQRIEAKLPQWIRTSYDRKQSGLSDKVISDLEAFFR